jgi:hypothetical protein
MTADARRGGSGVLPRGRKRGGTPRTLRLVSSRHRARAVQTSAPRRRRSRGGGEAQGGNRAVCPPRGENSEGIIPISASAETYRCASLFRARARHGGHLGHHGGAAAVLRAAGRTHDDPPARARSGRRGCATRENTIVFERPRNLARSGRWAHVRNDIPGDGEIQKAKPSTTTTTSSRKRDRFAVSITRFTRTIRSLTRSALDEDR